MSDDGDEKPERGLALYPKGAQGAPLVLSPVALSHAAATLALKGLGAPSRLIVACDTLKLRATSACASPAVDAAVRTAGRPNFRPRTWSALAK